MTFLQGEVCLWCDRTESPCGTPQPPSRRRWERCLSQLNEDLLHAWVSFLNDLLVTLTVPSFVKRIDCTTHLPAYSNESNKGFWIEKEPCEMWITCTVNIKSFDAHNLSNQNREKYATYIWELLKYWRKNILSQFTGMNCILVIWYTQIKNMIIKRKNV